MKLENKVAVVTGAGGGIGRQLVLQLLEKGASIAAVDINEDSLNSTREAAGEKGSRVSLHKIDITNRDMVCALPRQVLDFHGKIDILINNAGIIQPFVTFAELEYETMQRIMNINLFGPMFMIRAFLPHLASRPEAYIVNVSSMGGFLPVPGQTLYGASKAGVKLLTEGLRAELSQTNIGVSVVMPGGINTDIVKNSGVEMSSEPASKESEKAAMKLTTPGEAASTVLRGIEKNKPRILIGKDARFLDFYSRLAPVRAGRFIGKMMASTHSDSFNDAEKLKSKECMTSST